MDDAALPFHISKHITFLKERRKSQFEINNLLAGWSRADHHFVVSSCCGDRTLQDDAYMDKLTSKTCSHVNPQKNKSSKRTRNTCQTQQSAFTAKQGQRSTEQEKKKKHVCWTSGLNKSLLKNRLLLLSAAQLSHNIKTRWETVADVGKNLILTI